MKYLFYDYETSGLSKQFDQVFQFAAVRTDESFNETGETVDLLCRVRRDVIPGPYAVATNRLDINELNAVGLDESEFAGRVEETLRGGGGQCIVGFNSKSFDNEVSRFLFYRNFLDPYRWEWADGNCLLDVLDIVRMCYSFGRLENISVPVIGGRPSMKLGDLAEANGIGHENAHNALADARATVALARLVRRECPDLFDHGLRLRSHSYVGDLIRGGERFYHSDLYQSHERNFLSVNSYVCDHPAGRKTVICWNLRHDPEEILDLTAEEIAEQMFAGKDDRKFEVGFTELRLNKSPMVVGYARHAESRLVDGDRCTRNFEKFQRHSDRIREVANRVFFALRPRGLGNGGGTDPDASLYGDGILEALDGNRRQIEDARRNPLGFDPANFTDQRLKRLFRRFRARNHYDEISPDERAEFDRFCAARFASPEENRWRTKAAFDREFREAASDPSLSDREHACLRVLRDHVETMTGF